ncbi:MAG: DUF2299 family protein [Candidatus Rokubacteria bacterium]|nr:DUF2299 family protein [Candidatus Rokubacteria bacterium]
MPPQRRQAVPSATLRATVSAWLEDDGWSVADPLDRVQIAAGERDLRWLAVAFKDSKPLVVAEPAAGRPRLVLSHHLALDRAERTRLEALASGELDDLVWQLHRHLNLLLVDFEVDRPVPRQVLLTVSLPRDGLTRDNFLHHVARLTAALRIVFLVFQRALGTLLDEPGEPVTH